jgi:hypothetical protein
VLKSAVRSSKLGREEELGALKRLDEQARLLEQKASGPSVEELIADERDRSHAYEGRSVFGWALPEPSRVKTCPIANPRVTGISDLSTFDAKARCRTVD